MKAKDHPFAKRSVGEKTVYKVEFDFIKGLLAGIELDPACFTEGTEYDGDEMPTLWESSTEIDGVSLRWRVDLDKLPDSVRKKFINAMLETN